MDKENRPDSWKFICYPPTTQAQCVVACQKTHPSNEILEIVQTSP